MLPFTRDQAIDLLKKYNTEPFHIRHALTVEAVMRQFALKNGGDPDLWAMVGLLHDVDFEKYPERHCLEAPAMLNEIGAPEDFIRAVCSHGYGICVDIKPESDMEKTLFAVDELTGLIGAAVLMRPSRSAQDMDVKSLKKKFKDKRFAAGCSRDVIQQGAELMGIELDQLLSDTLDAYKACEADLNAACDAENV